MQAPIFLLRPHASRCESGSPLGSPALNNLAATLGGHADSKPMVSFAPQVAWLEGSFHFMARFWPLLSAKSIR